MGRVHSEDIIVFVFAFDISKPLIRFFQIIQKTKFEVTFVGFRLKKIIYGLIYGLI